MSGGTTEEDLRRTLRLFKRNMLSKAHPSLWSAGIRPPSLLEQSLLPKLSRLDDDDDASLSAENSSIGAQMTIFYGGNVHVYDNVSVDQFDAIKLAVASQTTSKDLPEITKHTSKFNITPANSKLAATAPYLHHCRRHSIQQFLEKRRLRLANQVIPYAAGPKDSNENKHRQSNSDDVGGREAGHKDFSPAPFPSKFGFSFP
ncbi:hypothetical protein QQ045_006332 [Rhodiola kirilowii]